MQFAVMAMRTVRRKKKKTVAWKPLFAILLLANGVVACYYSKVTVVRRITLDGVRESERERLQRVLTAIEGKPALKIDPRMVEGTFLAQSRVESADFRRNIFGGSLLRLKYRQPILRIAGNQNAFMDENGIIFSDPEVKSELPSLLLDPSIKLTTVAITGVINSKAIAETCTVLQKKMANTIYSGKSVQIEITEAGGVCLNIPKGKVVLGSHDQMKEKIEAFSSHMKSRPDLFENASELNLMVPDKPSVKLRNPDPMSNNSASNMNKS
jgi:cell division septal protein FtsQ